MISCRAAGATAFRARRLRAGADCILVFASHARSSFGSFLIEAFPATEARNIRVRARAGAD